MITITLDIDGNTISRTFTKEGSYSRDWDMVIGDMLNTLEKSNEPL